MRLRYTPQAQNDLRGIRAYLAKELQNPAAGRRATARITKSCGLLKEQPLLGLSLAEKIRKSTALRYLIQGSYLIFYRVDPDAVSIIRILDGRTDYLRFLPLTAGEQDHQ